MGGVIRGSAPKATLIIQSVLDSGVWTLGDYSILMICFKLLMMMEQGYTQIHGAVIEPIPLVLTMWMNLFGIPRLSDLLFLPAIAGEDSDGNGVINNGSIGSPGTAKNCITIGATENNRPSQSKPYGALGFSFPVAPISTDGWSDNPEGMAAFSS